MKLNKDGLIPLFSHLSARELQKVMKRAVKYATKKTQIKSVDIASKILNLKKKDIRHRVFIRTDLGSKDNPQGKVTMQYRSIGLDKFGARETAAGVRAKVFRKESPIVLRKAFIAQSKGRSTGKLVFVRKSAINESVRDYIRKLPHGNVRRSATGSELPIARLYSAGLSDVMVPHGNELAELAGEEGQKELERQIRLLLGA